jgi:hypothetical protein
MPETSCKPEKLLDKQFEKRAKNQNPRSKRNFIGLESKCSPGIAEGRWLINTARAAPNQAIFNGRILAREKHYKL